MRRSASVASSWKVGSPTPPGKTVRTRVTFVERKKKKELPGPWLLDDPWKNAASSSKDSLLIKLLSFCIVCSAPREPTVGWNRNSSPRNLVEVAFVTRPLNVSFGTFSHLALWDAAPSKPLQHPENCTLIPPDLQYNGMVLSVLSKMHGRLPEDPVRTENFSQLSCPKIKISAFGTSKDAHVDAPPPPEPSGQEVFGSYVRGTQEFRLDQGLPFAQTDPQREQKDSVRVNDTNRDYSRNETLFLPEPQLCCFRSCSHLRFGVGVRVGFGCPWPHKLSHFGPPE